MRTNFTPTTKNLYKENDREIEVTGKLFLINKRESLNLFNKFKYEDKVNISSINISNVDESFELYYSPTTIQGQDISSQTAKITYKVNVKENTKYTLNFHYKKYGDYLTTDNQPAKVGFKTYTSSTPSYPSDGSANWLMDVEIDGNSNEGDISMIVNSGANTTLYVWFVIKTNTSYMHNTTYVFTNVMLNEGTTALPYERYGEYVSEYEEFALDTTNECEIIGFNLNEKLDIYHTSLPCNTLTLDVNNEYGYFNDFDPNSIVEKLNTDCYLELYLKINNEQPLKILKINFDKIQSSDYTTAKLSFKSNIAKLKNLLFKNDPLGESRYFFNDYLWDSELKEWLKNIYNIDAKYDYNTTNEYKMVNLKNQNVDSVENVIMNASSYSDTSESGALIYNPLLTFNNTNDELVFTSWRINEGTNIQEYIYAQVILERPIVKRENGYLGVNYQYINSTTYQESSNTYTRTIRGKLDNNFKECIIIRDSNYWFDSITTENITVTDGMTFELRTGGTTSKDRFEILLTGELGQYYEININIPNIKRKETNDLANYVFGKTYDNSKVLNINETSPLEYQYYKYIINEREVKSFVEVDMMCLPYLEIGDLVRVFLDKNNETRVDIRISEINMKYDGGLTETIKGYNTNSVDKNVYPSDTLYPSNTLYPY